MSLHGKNYLLTSGSSGLGQAFADSRRGSIIVFSSAATHAGGMGLVSYAASKGALEAAARSLALELAPQRIRVNAIGPGDAASAVAFLLSDEAKWITGPTIALDGGLTDY